MTVIEIRPFLRVPKDSKRPTGWNKRPFFMKSKREAITYAKRLISQALDVSEPHQVRIQHVEVLEVQLSDLGKQDLVLAVLNHKGYASVETEIWSWDGFKESKSA